MGVICYSSLSFTVCCRTTNNLITPHQITYRIRSWAKPLWSWELWRICTPVEKPKTILRLQISFSLSSPSVLGMPASQFSSHQSGASDSLPMMPVGTHERWCCMHKTQSPENLTLKQTVHLLAPFSFCFISLLRKDTLRQPRHQRSSKIYHCCSSVEQLKIHFTNKKQEQLTPLIYGASSIASISRSSSAILQLCQQLFTMQSV